MLTGVLRAALNVGVAVGRAGCGMPSDPDRGRLPRTRYADAPG